MKCKIHCPSGSTLPIAGIIAVILGYEAIRYIAHDIATILSVMLLSVTGLAGLAAGILGTMLVRKSRKGYRAVRQTSYQEIPRRSMKVLTKRGVISLPDDRALTPSSRYQITAAQVLDGSPDSAPGYPVDARQLALTRKPRT